MSEAETVFISDPNALQQMIASELVNQTQDMLDELLDLRRQKNMTQQDVAEIIGVTRTAITAFERYDSDPKLSTIVRYALAVGARVQITVEDGQSWARNERDKKFVSAYMNEPEPSLSENVLASYVLEGKS